MTTGVETVANTPSGLARPGALDAFGTSIFAEMSALATAAGAINLGQGFPDEDGSPIVLEAASAAIHSGANQYAPVWGLAELREAVAAHEARWWASVVDPADVLVTAGATEAIAATILALCRAGDEVITFEPYYDSYAATIELAGARRRVVPLRPPDWAFDQAELQAAVTPATRLVLVNTPHNPSGRVLSIGELNAIARVCIDHDLIAVTDEVYEHLVFEGEHKLLRDLPGMAARTLKISSGGKTFATTGWKVGWILGPPALIESVKAVKQFLTFSNATPFQRAIATGLGLGDEYYTGMATAMKARRDRLCDGLESLGWEIMSPQATYFTNVDIRQFGRADGREFCRWLVREIGVAAIPDEVFFDQKQIGEPLVRFAFCKRLEVLDAALERLAAVKVG